LPVFERKAVKQRSAGSANLITGRGNINKSGMFSYFFVEICHEDCSNKVHALNISNLFIVDNISLENIEQSLLSKSSPHHVTELAIGLWVLVSTPSVGLVVFLRELRLGPDDQGK
jgi:hypothetical protein